DCRILILISLDNPLQLPILEEWRLWIERYAPQNIGGIEVCIKDFVRPEGGWPANSNLLLVSLPIPIWEAIPVNPSYSPISIIRSTNVFGKFTHLDQSGVQETNLSTREGEHVEVGNQNRFTWDSSSSTLFGTPVLETAAYLAPNWQDLQVGLSVLSFSSII